MGDLGDLKLAGRVATPDDPDWDEARQTWNLAGAQNPPAVALVESPDDVAKVIGFARENGH
ncbi:MAG: hypothetical protein ACRDK5_12085 [Solirubrobacterales bacterium]